MKKILISMIAIVLSITLAACGSNHAAKNHSDSNGTEQVSQDTQSNKYNQTEQKA